MGKVIDKDTGKVLGTFETEEEGKALKDYWKNKEKKNVKMEW